MLQPQNHRHHLLDLPPQHVVVKALRDGEVNSLFKSHLPTMISHSISMIGCSSRFDVLLS
jgi:hypothetical protein